jgi:hypothetical protein
MDIVFEISEQMYRGPHSHPAWVCRESVRRWYAEISMRHFLAPFCEAIVVSFEAIVARFLRRCLLRRLIAKFRSYNVATKQILMVLIILIWHQVRRVSSRVYTIWVTPKRRKEEYEREAQDQYKQRKEPACCPHWHCDVF